MKIGLSEEAKGRYKKWLVWLGGFVAAMTLGWEQLPDKVLMEAPDWLRSALTSTLVVIVVLLTFLKSLPDEDKDGVPDVLEGDEK